MPFFRDFELQLPLKLADKAIVYATNNLDWVIKDKTTASFFVRSKINILGRYPASFKIKLATKERNLTHVNIESSILVPVFMPILSEFSNKTYILENEEILVQNILLACNQIIEDEKNEQLRIDLLIDKGLLCPTCYREIAPGVIFCPDDGTKIRGKICPNCGNSESILSTFCTKCGNALE